MNAPDSTTPPSKSMSEPVPSPAPSLVPPLVLGELRVRLPIVQGGMGVGVSLSGLAGAVAAHGGVGVIATPGIGHEEPDFVRNYREANLRALRGHIRKARELAQGGVIGVNVMVALTNYAELARVAVEERADVLFSGAGLPLNLPEVTGPEAPIKLVPIVSSARAAQVLCKRWASRTGRLPDAVVLEGPLAGGHLGFGKEQLDDPSHSLETLLPQLLEALKPFEDKAGRAIPVIAAGGIFTGADIANVLRLGAAAAQMGTRFVATHECDAHLSFKELYVNAKEGDTRIIASPVGLPGRALGTPFLDALESREEREPFPCMYHCIATCDHKTGPYCIATALIKARLGNLDQGLVFAGHNAHRVREIVSVAELMASLAQECQASLAAD